MNIIPDFLPDSNLWSEKTKDGNFNKGRSGKIRMIVLHATVGTLESSRGWFRNRSSKVSAHYFVSKDGRILQQVHDEDTAYHAGISFWDGATDINDISIGIEIENLTGMKGFVGQDTYPHIQYQSVVELVKYLANKYSIVKKNVPTHQMIAPRRKTDPVGFPYTNLLADVFDVDPWSKWGTLFPLPVEQRIWGVPQAWLQNQWLGNAQSIEIYVDDKTSLTLFENGAVLYRKPTNKVSIIRY